MPRPRPLPLIALLCTGLCAACDDSGSSSGQSLPTGKNDHRSHSSKKHRNGDEPPRGEFKVGRLDHKLIPESSGVIASRRHDGVFWTHNDSGNGPTIFAIRRDGKLLGQYTLNVRNNDW